MTPQEASVEARRIAALAPIIPVLVVDDVAHARPLAEALVAGGLPALEVTLRTPAALDVIREMASVPGGVVGAGTLLTPADVRAAKAAGAITVIDGAQAVPHFKPDVQALDCDFYAFSSHKLFGPTGIGVLYGRKQLLEEMPPYQGGGEMIERVSFERTTWNTLPYKFEAGTPAIAEAVGLGAAIDYLASFDRNAIAAAETALLKRANALVESVPGMQIIGTAKHKVPVMSFKIDGLHPSDIGTLLDQQGIAIRTGHHCAMPLMDFYGVPGTARASFAFYNTLDEVEQLFTALQKIQRLFA